MGELRYEIKLVCAGSRLAQARVWIRLHPAAFTVAYPPRLVNNLYLDTPHLNSFNANVSGTSRRQKLRLRWYGRIVERVENPVLELKFKENMLGDKKRQRLAWVLEWQRPYSEILHELRRAAGSDWQRWLTTATQPALLNRYRREYYVTPDGALRATLDYDLQAYEQRLSPRPNRERPLLLPPTAIIEVKAAPAYSERLQAAMGHFPQPRTRNSKYINGILAAL